MLRDASHIPCVSSGSYPLRPGCAVKPLVDGEPAFERICAAVDAARKSVWITVAFVERDVRVPGAHGTFFDVLDRAQARGLDVRVIFWRSPQLPASEGHHFPGTDSERAWLAARGSRFQARWDRAEGTYCQHQKSWLVDAGEPGEIAFVGGINLEPSSVVPPGHAYVGLASVHDVYVEVRGPAATDVHHNFVQRWNEASDRGEPDGLWPDARSQSDLPFPQRLSPPAGDVPVQIQRAVRRGRYRDGTPTPGGEPFAIEHGEQSILDQYLRAIEAARSTIYIEDQVIAAPQIVAALAAALARGVEVAFLVPGEPHPGLAAALRRPESAPFAAALAALGRHEGFTLAAIAANAQPGQYADIYVHAKIALIDDAWSTIGSTNIANRSFFGDTELNATFWDARTVRGLRCELFREHLGLDTAALDDRSALRLYAEHARKNAARRERGEPLAGLAVALDPARYGRT